MDGFPSFTTILVWIVVVTFRVQFPVYPTIKTIIKNYNKKFYSKDSIRNTTTEFLLWD